MNRIQRQLVQEKEDVKVSLEHVKQERDQFERLNKENITKVSESLSSSTLLTPRL